MISSTPSRVSRSWGSGDAISASAVPVHEGTLHRVAYVAGLDPRGKFGSLEEQILLVARAFHRDGACFVPVFAGRLSGEAAREYAAAGVAAEALDLQRFSLGHLRMLLALLDRHQIELVHWSFYHPLNPYFWAVNALRPGLRHVHTDHNSRWQTLGTHTPGVVRRTIKSLLFARYGQIVCVSDFVAEWLRRDGVRTTLTPCAHFINTDRFQPDGVVRERVRRELGAAERFVVLQVGRLIEEKGADVLLRAVSRLPEEIVVWLVGDGSESPRLRQLAAELGIEERVRFLGDRDRAEPFMQGADCLVCPCRWEEAAGLVNIEGLACGLPVVASRSGGIPEIVDDGRTGLLVTPGEIDELAAALHRLFEDGSLHARMAHEARRAALDRHSPERRIPDYLDLYRRPLGEPHVR